MKTLLSLDGGAVTVTEQGGVFYLNIDASLSLGGGLAAGIVFVQDKGSVGFKGLQGLKLLEAVLNSHIPAVALPAVEGGEALLNAAIAGA